MNIEKHALTGSQYISKFIESQNIDTVFGLTGGYIHKTIDTICENTNIQFITCHHEQAASFAAVGYSRITGRPGICMGISGPGGINMIAGVADVYYDSYPLICITGQVNLNEMVGDRKIRQHGFQECDIISIMKSITKESELVKDIEELSNTLNKIFKSSIDKRKGPCLIDIPLNIQCSKTDFLLPEFIEIKKENINYNQTNMIEKLLSDITISKKPLILLGGGINSSNSRNLAIEFINIMKIPCVHSLLGCDVLPFSHKSYIGMIGTYGMRVANHTIMQSDTILVLGSRLDMRQTGIIVQSFENKNIYQVDIDENEVNFRVKGVSHIHLDLNTFFIEAINIAKNKNIRCNCADWEKIIEENKNKWKPELELIDFGYNKINPNIFMDKLSIYSQVYNTNYTIGIGNIQMWAAQSIKLKEGQRMLIPGGLSSMGCALPMAIGACFATKKLIPYLVIEGDGGIQLNIQELQTIIRNDLPIKIIIMNNSSLGMIRQFCDQGFEGRYNQIEVNNGYDNPNFVDIAKAYKIDSYKLEYLNDIDNALNKLWENPYKSFILEVIILKETYVAPKVPYGNSLDNMIPKNPGEPMNIKRKFIVNN